MANGFPPGGVLFTNDKKGNEKAPAMTGKLEISQELLRALNDLAIRNQPIEMRLAAWSKEGAKGRFLSLAASDASPPQQRSERSYDSTHAGGRSSRDDIPF